MARKPRVHYPGAYYHVMLRGNGGMQIFHDQDDHQKLLDLLQETIIRFEYRIHAFCLMTNHVHFAIQVSNISLSKIIQNISFRYTCYFNKKTKRIGHLFQGRYKALIVDADSYLLQLIRYIHLNPLRANMVVNILDYPWSSHLAYLGQSNIHWLTTQSVFDLLTNNKNQETVTAYQEFMSDQPRDAVNFSLSMQKNFPAICDDAFMKKLIQLQKIDERIIKVTLRELVKLICGYYAVKESDLHRRSQNRLFSKIRLMIAKLVVQLKVANLTDIATYFNRDMSTFSRGLSRMPIAHDVELDAIRYYIESTIVQA
jgi:REP element-mobilizing transposase RayT